MGRDRSRAMFTSWPVTTRYMHADSQLLLSLFALIVYSASYCGGLCAAEAAVPSPRNKHDPPLSFSSPEASLLLESLHFITAERWGVTWKWFSRQRGQRRGDKLPTGTVVPWRCQLTMGRPALVSIIGGGRRIGRSM